MLYYDLIILTVTKKFSKKLSAVLSLQFWVCVYVIVPQ